MATKQASEIKTFSTRVMVVIKRDMTDSAPRIIWAHEKPLLEEIHGDDNVQAVETIKLDEGFSAKIAPNLLRYNKTQDRVLPPSELLGLGFVFIGNAAEEYQRLANAYGRHPEIDMTVVEKVYGRFQVGTFARLLPQPTLEDLPAQQLRTLITDYGYPGDVAKDDTPADKKEHADKVRGLRDMPTGGLLELARELAVEI